MSKPKVKIDEAIFKSGVDEPLGNLTVNIGEWITYKGKSDDVKDHISEISDRWESAYDEMMSVLDDISNLTGQVPSWR